MRTRRKLLRNALGVTLLCGLARKVPAAPAKGWTIHIGKVHDLLKLKAGGPLGPVIHWNDRGDEHYTWKNTDPEEEHSLDRWFQPDAVSIQLAAELDKVDPTRGERACELTILFNGKSVEEWNFAEKESAKTFRRT